MDDDAAPDGAVGADTAGLRGARDLELAHLRLGPGNVEAESDRASDGRGLQKSATGQFHGPTSAETKRGTIPELRHSFVKDFLEAGSRGFYDARIRSGWA